ncbi:LysR family transcriptional regulator [Georgenia yuyongxinii]|nr:LysR family transcriptional regulator [Georgenia yuyongxinii]
MELSRIDLNLLVALDALLSERSVTRAADRLTVGQPAMSATLMRLRKLFDDELLVRQGRGMILTPVAEALIQPVRDVILHVEAVFAARRTFEPSTTGRSFSVTANDYVTRVFLRPLLEILANEAPNLSFDINAVRDDYETRLSREETDLLIIPSQVFPGHTAYSYEVLFQDRYVCAVDADNAEVGAALTLEQFSELPYVAFNVGLLRSHAEIQLDAQGVARNTQVSIQSPTVAPYLLRGTRRVTIIQERLGRAFDEAAHLRLVEPPVELAPVTMVMVWGRHAEHDPGHRWFRQRVAAFAGETMGQD